MSSSQTSTLRWPSSSWTVFDSPTTTFPRHLSSNPDAVACTYKCSLRVGPKSVLFLLEGDRGSTLWLQNLRSSWTGWCELLIEFNICQLFVSSIGGSTGPLFVGDSVFWLTFSSVGYCCWWETSIGWLPWMVPPIQILFHLLKLQVVKIYLHPLLLKESGRIRRRFGRNLGIQKHLKSVISNAFSNAICFIVFLITGKWVKLCLNVFCFFRKWFWIRQHDLFGTKIDKFNFVFKESFVSGSSIHEFEKYYRCVFDYRIYCIN